MTKPKAPKFVFLTCPICSTNYQTPKNKPTPTCGYPNCIRELRGLLLPTTADTPTRRQLAQRFVKRPHDKVIRPLGNESLAGG